MREPCPGRARLANLDGKKDMWRRYEQTLKLVQDQFIDKANGGWLSVQAACQVSNTPQQNPTMPTLPPLALGRRAGWPVPTAW